MGDWPQLRHYYYSSLVDRSRQQKCCAWFDANEVEFIKRPDQGKMKDVVFVKDVDGYWIEVVEAAKMAGKGD